MFNNLLHVVLLFHFFLLLLLFFFCNIFFFFVYFLFTMGACMSSLGLSPADRSRIEKRLAELVKTWTIEYIKAYKTCLLQKIREDSAPPKQTYERQVVPLEKDSESTKPHHHGYVYRTKSDGILDTKFYKVYWVLDKDYDLWEFKEQPAVRI